MSLRNLRHWMNEATNKRYAGPTEAAVLLKDGTRITAIDLTDWQESYERLNAIDAEQVAATFCKAPKGGWGGTATVPCAIGGMQNLYVTGQDDLNTCILKMTLKLVGHQTYLHQLAHDPESLLDLLLRTHDWYAAYSDMPGVLGASDRHFDRARDLMKALPAEKVRAIFTKYAPEGFTCPV